MLERIGKFKSIMYSSLLRVTGDTPTKLGKEHWLQQARSQNATGEIAQFSGISSDFHYKECTEVAATIVSS